MSFLSSIFGGGVKPVQVAFNPKGFSGGGLVGDANTGAVTPTADRTSAVGDISNNFANFGNETGALRRTVAPGFNDLLNARLLDLQNRATQAVGDLRQNLSARRILGSSFGQDTLTRANAEFGQQRDQIIADNFLKSLAANNELMGQQYKAYSDAFNTRLNELNLEASTASKLSSDVNNQLAAAQRLQAQLNQQAAIATMQNNTNLAGGFGSFLGRIAGPALSNGFSGLTSALGGAGAAGAAADAGTIGVDAAGMSAGDLAAMGIFLA